jgi:hypothetical protein
VAWQADAEALPIDRHVGTAAMLVSALTPGFGYVYNVMLQDGTQYRLTTPAANGPGVGGPPTPMLSPDGRWLAWNTEEGAQVRNLTSAETKDLDGLSIYTWSPNGEWALASDLSSESRVVALRTSDWQRSTTTGRAGNLGRVAILNDGNMLDFRQDAAQRGSAFSLAVLSPAGSEVREIEVDTAPVLNANEFAVEYSDGRAIGPRVSFGTDFGVLQLSYGYQDIGYAEVGPFVVFSLTDGTVHRIDMPGFTPASPNWSLEGVVDDELLVTQFGSGVPQIAIETVDPDSGVTQGSLRVAVGTHVLPRGSRI